MKIFYGSGYFSYHRFLYRFVLIALASFMLSGCHQPLKQADYWKAKVLEAHGGKGALGQVVAVVYKGRINTRGDSGTVMLTLSRPGKLRATMKYLKQDEDRVLIEKKGWRNFGDGFEEAQGRSLDAMIFQYNHLNLPMGILDGNFKISFTRQKVGEQEFPILEFIAEEEPPMAVLIDPETGLIQQVSGKIFMGENEVVMGIAYWDYREVSGVMLPHKIINYVNGTAIAESSYDTVLVNPQLDPKTFEIQPHETLQR